MKTSDLRFNDANRVPFPFAQVKRAMSAYITISTTGTSRPSVSSMACSSRTLHPAPRSPPSGSMLRPGYFASSSGTNSRSAVRRAWME